MANKLRLITSIIAIAASTASIAGMQPQDNTDATRRDRPTMPGDGLPAFNSPKQWIWVPNAHAVPNYKFDDQRQTNTKIPSRPRGLDIAPDDRTKYTRMFQARIDAGHDYVIVSHHLGRSTEDQEMELDWLGDALAEPDLLWILQDFADGARTFLDGAEHRRLIVYMGAVDRFTTKRGDDYTWTILDMIRSIHPRIEFCFDAASGIGENDDALQTMIELEQLGHLVWIEAMPRDDRPWLHRFGTICFDQFYRRIALQGKQEMQWSYSFKGPSVAREAIVVFTGHSGVPFLPQDEPDGQIKPERRDNTRPWLAYGAELMARMHAVGWSIGFQPWEVDRRKPVADAVGLYDGPVGPIPAATHRRNLAGRSDLDLAISWYAQQQRERGAPVGLIPRDIVKMAEQEGGPLHLPPIR